MKSINSTPVALKPSRQKAFSKTTKRATMNLLYPVALTLSVISCSRGCRLGHTISSLTVNGPGRYAVKCSSRVYPICPEYCYWTTNETCNDYANRRHWARHRHMLTNITYSYPINEKTKHHLKDDKEFDKRQPHYSAPRRRPAQNQPTTRHTTRVTPAPNRRSIERKCCTGGVMNFSTCRQVDWSPNSSNGHKFDVAAYAKKNLHCKQEDAVVKDIKVKNFQKSNLSIEVCCLNYTGAATVVACARWEHGGEEAAIAAAVALPLALALGIGIPLLLLKCHREKFAIHPNFVITCYGTQQNYFDISEDRCCAICGRSGADVSACLYGVGAPAKIAFPGSGGRATCTVCHGRSGDPTEYITGVVLFVKL